MLLILIWLFLLVGILRFNHVVHRKIKRLETELEDRELFLRKQQEEKQGGIKGDDDLEEPLR